MSLPPVTSEGLPSTSAGTCTIIINFMSYKILAHPEMSGETSHEECLGKNYFTSVLHHFAQTVLTFMMCVQN